MSEPRGSEDVENVAVPEDNVTGAPKFVPLVLNCTLPVAEIGKTEDVKVIDCPVTDGFCDDNRDIVVPIWCTTWERMLVLAAKIALPEYVDDMECVPTDNDDTTNEA